MTQFDLGALANHPVIVFDDEKDADNHIKELEQKSGDFFGNNGMTMWKKVPIIVHLNEKKFKRDKNE